MAARDCLDVEPTQPTTPPALAEGELVLAHRRSTRRSALLTADAIAVSTYAFTDYFVATAAKAAWQNVFADNVLVNCSRIVAAEGDALASSSPALEGGAFDGVFE